jgi:hypothetical protein
METGISCGPEMVVLYHADDIPGYSGGIGTD